MSRKNKEIVKDLQTSYNNLVTRLMTVTEVATSCSNKSCTSFSCWYKVVVSNLLTTSNDIRLAGTTCCESVEC